MNSWVLRIIYFFELNGCRNNIIIILRYVDGGCTHAFGLFPHAAAPCNQGWEAKSSGLCRWMCCRGHVTLRFCQIVESLANYIKLYCSFGSRAGKCHCHLVDIMTEVRESEVVEIVDPMTTCPICPRSGDVDTCSTSSTRPRPDIGSLRQANNSTSTCQQTVWTCLDMIYSYLVPNTHHKHDRFWI